MRLRQLLRRKTMCLMWSDLALSTTQIMALLSCCLRLMRNFFAELQDWVILRPEQIGLWVWNSHVFLFVHTITQWLYSRDTSVRPKGSRYQVLKGYTAILFKYGPSSETLLDFDWHTSLELLTRVILFLRSCVCREVVTLSIAGSVFAVKMRTCCFSTNLESHASLILNWLFYLDVSQASWGRLCAKKLMALTLSILFFACMRSNCFNHLFALSSVSVLTIHCQDCIFLLPGNADLLCCSS